MTSEEIGRLTIAEVEAIVARATDALTKFREAQALLGGAPPPVNIWTPVGVPPSRAQIAAATASVNFTPSELAERARLVKQNRADDFPADIAALENA